MIRQAFIVVLAGLGGACATGDQSPSLDSLYEDIGSRSDIGITGPCAKCNDYNTCTRDLCLISGGCTYENLPKNNACDDDDACTGNDRCDGKGKCTGTGVTDVLYRYKHWGKSTYFYSRSKTSAPNGYGFEKPLAGLMRPGSSGTVALYRMYSSTNDDFMLTRNAQEGTICCGYKMDGTVGYVFAKQQPNTVPLHRLVKNSKSHMTTLDPKEATALGYKYEKIQAYVCK